MVFSFFGKLYILGGTGSEYVISILSFFYRVIVTLNYGATVGLVNVEIVLISKNFLIHRSRRSNCLQHFSIKFNNLKPFTTFSDPLSESIMIRYISFIDKSNIFFTISYFQVSLFRLFNNFYSLKLDIFQLIFLCALKQVISSSLEVYEEVNNLKTKKLLTLKVTNSQTVFQTLVVPTGNKPSTSQDSRSQTAAQL